MLLDLVTALALALLDMPFQTNEGSPQLQALAEALLLGAVVVCQVQRVACASGDCIACLVQC